MIVTRFAPSPTGRLHLGHAYSAVRAHDFARTHDGAFLLRIEDIDGTRSRAEHVAGILEDLRWLGLAWDGEVVFQSARLDRYEAALERLKAMGLLYPCFCTRADIAASASAPHGPSGALYPGTCRRLSEPERATRMGDPHAWRLEVGRAVASLPTVIPALGRDPPGGERAIRGSSGSRQVGWTPAQGRGDGGGVRWHDAHAGWVEARPEIHGDVVLARKDAPASYHLAVTIDDAAQGVTDVVRGVDLFAATDVHRLLQALLDLPTPRYHHHPLLTDAAGQRLAKRSGAPTLADLRAGGADGGAIADALRQGRTPLGFGLANP